MVASIARVQSPLNFLLNQVSICYENQSLTTLIQTTSLDGAIIGINMLGIIVPEYSYY
jgi:hypothetical protein